MSNSALPSLVAQYSDSEYEDDDIPVAESSMASQAIIPKQSAPEPEPESVKKSMKRKRGKKVRRLVSYQGEAGSEESSEELSSSDSESSEADSKEQQESGHEKSEGIEDNDDKEKSDDKESSDDKEAGDNNEKNDGKARGEPKPPIKEDENDSDTHNVDELIFESDEKDAKYAKYKFELPPEPQGDPPPELVAKINDMYQKMRESKMDMNSIIQNSKEFRNPSIYETLISYCGINEYGTNLPPEVYDPVWGEESHYEALAEAQKKEMARQQSIYRDLNKLKKATEMARKVEEDVRKRKLKRDQNKTGTERRADRDRKSPWRPMPKKRRI